MKKPRWQVIEILRHSDPFGLTIPEAITKHEYIVLANIFFNLLGYYL